LRALSYRISIEKNQLIQALDLLRRAVELDPRYGLALALAGLCHAQLDLNGWTDDRETNRRTGLDLARRALRAAPEEPDVLVNAASALALFGEDLDVAVGLMDRCLALNPSFARGWYASGVLKTFVGQPELALEHFDTFLRLNPRDRLPWYLTGIGAALFFNRRFDEAAGKLLASLEQRPTFALTYRFLASCYTHLGRLDEAREVVNRLKLITSIVVPSATPYRDPEHRELFLSGLRLAAGEAE
jgi:lipoprotein NlpI